jgi:Trypsin-like peptidase domain
MPPICVSSRCKTLIPVRVNILALAFCVFSFAATVYAQQAGGVAPSGPQVRMVRAVVGAKGEPRNGTYVMTDRRTTFYIPDDREVVVYFEWEGPQGRHHCEASVRGPNGEFTTMSSFDYNATQPRFGGYWKMPLSESTPAGSWVFESKVDGESAGDVTFQVIPGATPANLPKAAPLPTVSELYKLVLASTVQIEKLDTKGEPMRSSSGFLTKQGQVTTSFRSIDGARSLRLRFADGSQATTDQVLAWNRRQDWVILAVATGAPALKTAEPKSWNVGDPCSWLDAKNEASRVLSQGQIVGMQPHGSWGERIELSGSYTSTASGGPLVNERGQVIGVLGGILPDSLVNELPSAAQVEGIDLYYSSTNGTSVAINLIPETLPAQPIPLNELWNKGEMTPPIQNSKYVAYGMLSLGIKPGGKSKTLNPATAEMKVSFHRSDGTASAVITFANNETLKSTARVNIYDIDNHPIATGMPEKLNVNRGELSRRTWQFPISALAPGIYRFDLVIGDGVAWRQFFKVTD